MTIVKTSAKGQLVIPKKYRKSLGIEPGGNVILAEIDNTLVIKPAPKDPVAAVCGFLEGGPSLREDLLREHREEAERDKRRRSR